MEYNTELFFIQHLSKVIFMKGYLNNAEFIHFSKCKKFYLFEARVPILV